MLRVRVAVLLTCHNRRDTTLSCLAALSCQTMAPEVECRVFLVDDGSYDGTGAAVRQKYPNVVVLTGDGNLYWGGGMRLAWAEAVKERFDFYLWLNDDTILLPSGVATLINAYRRVSARDRSCGIVVGSACDPSSGKLTYGGFADACGRVRISPSDDEQQCITMNGNIVLVTSAVATTIGNLSPDYRHTHGDMDYGLRARKSGFTIWVAPGFQGKCRPNGQAPWQDPATPLTQRWRSLHSPKGLPPRETAEYARRHLACWPLVLMKLYFRMLFPASYNWAKQRIGN